MPAEEEKPRALTVTEAMGLAKGALEAVTIRLVGEVCELNDKPGYKAVYFSVKDEHAVLPCQMWLSRYNANGLRFKVGDVLELTGRFTLYAAKGRMSFDVFSFTAAGEGTLRMRVEALARKLQAEGLMDDARKRPIPVYPDRIGVVTSPRGDAVHDVFRTLRRRFPLAQVLFAGVPVEGTGAAKNIMDGMVCLVNAGAEVILVVRGGGSYEDLMPYNDERLCRTIARCPVPVVTGIGHEPDTTIADMVADRRASTPTAAAEAVSPAPKEMAALFAGKRQRLETVLTRRLERLSHDVALRANRPVFAHPETLYDGEARHLDDALDAFRRLQQRLPERLSKDIALRTSRLHDLSPLNVLDRGYAIARTGEGGVVKSVGAVSPGDGLRITVSDGDIFASVTSTEARTDR